MSALRRAIQSLCVVMSVIGGVLLQAPALADSVPFWGAKASVPIDTPIDQLKKGEFLWMGEAVTTGPVVMVVSITEQRAYVYRNGILIGATTVSTGRPGHPTPTGVFTVLQKQKEHRSTIYDGAPMPYMERLTWGGIALHGDSASAEAVTRKYPVGTGVSVHYDPDDPSNAVLEPDNRRGSAMMLVVAVLFGGVGLIFLKIMASL